LGRIVVVYGPNLKVKSVMKTLKPFFGNETKGPTLYYHAKKEKKTDVTVTEEKKTRIFLKTNKNKITRILITQWPPLYGY